VNIARYLLRIRLIPLTLSLCLLAAIPAHHVSADDLVVVVSVRSNIDALTRQQVKDIYLGALSSFPNGLKAIPIDQVDGSALRDQFHSLVTGKTRHQLRAHWARKVFSGKGTPPLESDNPAEIREWIAAAPGRIGYIGRHQVDAMLKVVFVP